MARYTNPSTLHGLSRRSAGALREVAAGGALLVLWVLLWSWLIAGVAGPAHAAKARLAARAEPGAAVTVTLAR